MKKIIVSSLLAISVLALVACGGSASTPPQTVATPTAPAQSEASQESTPSQNIGSNSGQFIATTMEFPDGYFTFGDTFTLEAGNVHLEVTIGTDFSFSTHDRRYFPITDDMPSNMRRHAEQMNYYYEKDIAIIPVTITNIGEAPGVGDFFTFLGGMRVINPHEGDLGNSHWNRQYLSYINYDPEHVINSNPDLNLNRDRSYWDIVWSWSDELEGTELLQPGETINRKIHIAYYVDGDYVLRVSGGRAFLKFPIVKP